MSQINMRKQQSTYRSSRKFGMKDKIGYMLGDLGNDFFFILVASFLMVYYTDVFHISASAVGTIFFVARLWDAVADVAWGRFVDTRMPSGNGKFKPWILRMSFPLVIAGVLLFVRIPNMSDSFYFVYAFVTYLLWGTLYSTVNIPYGSMASVITSHPLQRTELSTSRTLGANVAAFVVNVIGPVILFVDNQAYPERFTIVAVLFGVFSLICYMMCYNMSTERVVTSFKKQPSFGKTLRQLTRNVPFVSLLLASLLFMMCTLLLGAVNVYLFKDYFGNMKALSVIGIVQTVIVIIAVPFTEAVVRRFGKKEVASIGLLLSSVVYALLYMMPGLPITQFISLLVLAMLGISFFQLVVWAFVTDVIDYHEYLTGRREEGTVYSVYSFARKVGQALAGGLGGYAIAGVGYHAEDTLQAAETLEGIRTLATLVPAVIFFVIFIIFMFIYPLNRRRLEKVGQELSRRNKSLKRE